MDIPFFAEHWQALMGSELFMLGLGIAFSHFKTTRRGTVASDLAYELGERGNSPEAQLLKRLILKDES